MSEAIVMEMILSQAKHLTWTNGLYVLLDNHDEPIYVGQSSCCERRVYEHAMDSGKDFSRYAILPSLARGFTLDQLEAEMIWDLNPRGNTEMPRNPYYKTLADLKRLYEGQAFTKRTLNKVIRRHNPRCVCGAYDIRVVGPLIEQELFG